ncbi:MAG: SDR family oxidoreductase [Emcibacter sp.]|nr:SDR family oxidoreductase [Emcibacter sp.]
MLRGKTIIVTGANSGIGWGVAQAVHAAGANILLHGLEVNDVSQCAQNLGERAAWVAGDLRIVSHIEELIPAAIQAFGQVDGLVNNAAVLTRDNLQTTTADIHDEIMAINCRAPMLLSQQIVREFRKQGSGGSIVNIGSINAHCGQSNILSYSMSKGAMQTMTRNLGDSLGAEKIRVNQLNVGWTLTENEDRLQRSEGRPESWLEEVPDVFAPSGALLLPENIAPHVIFWLSDASAPVNGQVYEVEQYPLIGRNKIDSSIRD